jgi:microcin C transport system substrate-binding protein
VPEAVFTTVFDPPDYPDATAFRNGLRTAFGLLKEAGWTFRDNRLVNDATGQPFEFEFMNDEPRLERVILPFLKNLERLGIKGTIRSVDAAQADNRTRDYDFDMLSVNYGASLTPGNELRQLYSSAAAGTPGSPNLAGVKDPVVDELVELIINTGTRANLVTRVRALDRVLLHGHYGVPNWYQDKYRVAYWDKFGMPSVHPKYVSMPAGAVSAWWFDEGKGTTVASEQERLEQP